MASACLLHTPSREVLSTTPLQGFCRTHFSLRSFAPVVYVRPLVGAALSVEPDCAMRRGVAPWQAKHLAGAGAAVAGTSVHGARAPGGGGGAAPLPAVRRVRRASAPGGAARPPGGRGGGVVLPQGRSPVLALAQNPKTLHPKPQTLHPAAPCELSRAASCCHKARDAESQPKTPNLQPMAMTPAACVCLQGGRA
jgi:hypothetical protein